MTALLVGICLFLTASGFITGWCLGDMHGQESDKGQPTVEQRLDRVRALAHQYEADARSEGYGGELWSTTAAAIHAALDGTDPRNRDGRTDDA